MINTRKQLHCYLACDRIMNRGTQKRNIKQTIHDILYPDLIMHYLRYLRIVEYLSNQKKGGIISYYYRKRYINLGLKLGFSIPINVFGYGLVIPHPGTVVVGGGNVIGNYCVLHTSTCITAGAKRIGDCFYLSTGAKVIHDINIGNNISVAANSVMNHSYSDDDALIGGMPAYILKKTNAWYLRDGEKYKLRHDECERIISECLGDN